MKTNIRKILLTLHKIEKLFDLSDSYSTEPLGDIQVNGLFTFTKATIAYANER